MSADLFLDTNDLVNAYDTHEPVKQTRAHAILRAAMPLSPTGPTFQVVGKKRNMMQVGFHDVLTW